VIAWLLGIPLSYLLYRALLVAFNFSEAMGFAYRFSTVLVGLGAMLLVAALASLWPSLSAARKTVANILRYQ
jgi:ABC-type antimicrobial peptide transport system permease subunit